MRDDSTIAPDVPILMSRFAVPSPPQGMLERPRLTERLAAAAATPVTLLVAPAGWGKTALLAEWFGRGGPGHPAAWLSIDPGDAAEAFWPYLSRALSLPPMPGDHHDPGLIILADALSRRREPILLVLDDAHHLRDPGAWSGLDFLLRHTSGKLRLVIAGREAPLLSLPRRRLAGELAEIPSGELAFTLGETRELLARWGLDLPADEARALHERTEGWPAGIRFEATTSTSADSDAEAARFLRQEVLGTHPPELADALARASVGDHLNGGLIDALTGRDDGIALLDRLERSSMFVVRVDRPPWTHRFHRMFAEVLRASLRGGHPRLIPDLHGRAARWHAAHGLPGEALHHALAGGDAALAVEIVRESWPQLILHRGTPQEPSTPREVSDPMLVVAQAADHLGMNDLGGANRLLRLAERLQTARPEAAAEGFSLVGNAFQLALARAHGDTARVLSASAGVLAMVPDHDDAGRAAVLALRGEAQLIAGDTAGAIGTLREAADRAELSGAGCQRLVATGVLALAEASYGWLCRAETTAHRALDLPACPGRPSAEHRAEAQLALAIVDMQRGDPAEAHSHLRMAAGTDLQAGLAVLIAQTTAEALLDKGDLAGAHRALDDGRRILEQAPVSRSELEQRLAVTEAEMHTFHGDTGAARETLAPFDPHESPAVAVALARAHLRGGEAHAAQRALQPWTEDSAPALRQEVGALQALAAHRLGDRRRAVEALESALKLAEGQGFRRVFARSGTAGRQLLTEQLDTGTAHWALIQELIGAQRAPAGTPSPEIPLSARELAVLRYLQGVLSNPEIASELSVSVNTVKTHVRSIYRKLRASSRRDAVKRARELQLL